MIAMHVFLLQLSQEQKDEMFQQLQDQLTSIKELDTVGY